jgi:hypothetical protein
MERADLRGSWTRWLSLGPWALVLLLAGCGSDSPTKPEAVSLSDLFGTELLKADGSRVGVGSLEQNTLLGIYFMSPGCPACSAFNPSLVTAYDEITGAGNAFEIVMVAQGINPTDLSEYMAEEGMEWTAVSPLSDRPTFLAQRYNVRWIPTLIVIETDGTIVSMSGREQVAGQGADAWNIWMSAGSGS